MTPVRITRRAPVLRQATLSFILAVAALLLAWYGSLHAEKHLAGSPLRDARGSANVVAEPGNWYERVWDRAEAKLFGGQIDRRMLELTQRSARARFAVQIVAFVLPLILGLAAALLGGNALTAIEKWGGTRSGNFQATFAIMIGGFAAVIAACMVVSIYLWPHLPSLYIL